MTHRLYQGDSLKLLQGFAPIRCIFADPPDGIGLGYNEFNDKTSDRDYRAFLYRLVQECTDKADIVWFSFNAKWTAALGRIVDLFLDHHDEWEFKPCVQVFTFGQHNSHDLGNNHRPLWRLMKKGTALYPENIKVPSWRQRNGDKRAAAGGRVPGDVFDMQYCEDEIYSGDVFDFPRVTGNSKQRCDWHPTQLHEELVKRCLLLSTQPGDTVVDPFGGTGTTMRVCKEINRNSTLIEFDEMYCQKIVEAHGLTWRKGGWWS